MIAAGVRAGQRRGGARVRRVVVKRLMAVTWHLLGSLWGKLGQREEA